MTSERWQQIEELFEFQEGTGGKSGRYPPILFAENYARLGEKDQAFGWLEKAYQQRRPLVTKLNSDHFLRSDPRYADLVRRRSRHSLLIGSKLPQTEQS